LTTTVEDVIVWVKYIESNFNIKSTVYRYKDYDPVLKKANIYYAVVVNSTYDYNNALEWKDWAIKVGLKDTFIWKYSD